MREREIEDYLVRCVREAGGEVRKVSWLGRRGAPDRRVMLPGVAPVWVELKAPGVKAEPHQLREHERMRALGEKIVIVDSLIGAKALVYGGLSA